MRTASSIPQLETFIQEIRAVGESRTFLWLPLMGALALIDICASLERPDPTKKSAPGEVGKRFRDWIDANLSEYSHRPFGQVDRPGYFDFLAGADMSEPPKGEQNMTASSIWHFRCSLLHEGTTDLDKKGDLDKVLFAHPQGGVHVQDGLLRVGDERFAVTDMLAFTGAVCNAADGWLARSRNTEPVKTNLTRLLSLTPGQLFGTPVTFVGYHVSRQCLLIQ